MRQLGKEIQHLSLIIGLSGTMLFGPVKAQVSNPEAIKAMIARYKTDPRGPYEDIRWFCKDGTMRAARDPCPNAPGNQRARYKSEVQTLADKEHIFLGQILATTPHTDFWDDSHAHSRLKQYQLEQYLQNIDNGWVNRLGQYYRGAKQIEDENSWGVEFYKWVLSDAGRVNKQYFLLRQSAKDIPHGGENNNTQLVRTLSTEISDAYPAFQFLRVKIHGIPDAIDRQRVIDFQQQHKGKLSAAVISKLERLADELAVMYRPFQISDFEALLKALPKDSEVRTLMDFFSQRYPALTCANERVNLIGRTCLMIRQLIVMPMKSSARLALIDITNRMENLLNNEASTWRAGTLEESLEQVHALSQAAAAFGYLEQWEWDQIQTRMRLPQGTSLTMQQWNEFNESGRYVTEWGAGMVRAHYLPVIRLYQEFEPLASGFLDDRIRSSVLLHLGHAVSRLGDSFAREAGFSNAVMGISGQSSIRGLNPGYAVGELVVVTESPEKIEMSPDKIYVFQHASENLKPVAGIMTVSEGNLVSHVQLLARNLGIPNAVISQDQMDALKAHHGKKVFYAVSNRGTVIMKPAGKMDAMENELFEDVKKRSEKITVPVQQLVLDRPQIINLREINASHSGKICGPKAANLGQLKQLFPQNVVEGLVLPFAVFRQHMDQRIPGHTLTYWERMNGIFDRSKRMRCLGNTEVKIEAYVLQQLDSLRGLIKQMPLLPSFKEELKQKFQHTFRQPLGKVPVFIRSDTNMEDLKDFTGAGLNLTVFNVLDSEKIFQGIRDVWASPYTERSFKWRQSYLLNPENVFPSILIIPSVDADHSGVLITKGLTTGEARDNTIAFNRGVGGAVDGQAAETWLIRSEDDAQLLIAPAREPSYLTIPATGGSVRRSATFERRILTPNQLLSLSIISACIQAEFPKIAEFGSEGPFDIELGFSDDHLWLFQVRPFVENKQAAASDYLQRITPVFKETQRISLNHKLQK